MHLEASFSFLGLPIPKLGMVEGQMGFSPTVDQPPVLVGIQQQTRVGRIIVSEQNKKTCNFDFKSDL